MENLSLAQIYSNPGVVIGSIYIDTRKKTLVRIEDYRYCHSTYDDNQLQFQIYAFKELDIEVSGVVLWDSYWINEDEFLLLSPYTEIGKLLYV